MYPQNANAMRSVKNSPFLGQYSANLLYSLNTTVRVPASVVCSDNTFIAISIVYSNLVLIWLEKQMACCHLYHFDFILCTVK